MQAKLPLTPAKKLIQLNSDTAVNFSVEQKQQVSSEKVQKMLSYAEFRNSCCIRPNIYLHS